MVFSVNLHLNVNAQYFLFLMDVLVRHHNRMILDVHYYLHLCCMDVSVHLQKLTGFHHAVYKFVLVFIG